MPPLDKKKLAALVAMIESFDQKGYVDENFEKAVKVLLQYVAKIKADAQVEFSAKMDEVIGATTTATNALTDKVDETLDRVVFEHTALMSEIKRAVDELEDGAPGKDADEDEIVSRVLRQIPIPKAPKVDLTPIEKKIATLDERIKNTRTAPFIGPSRGVFLHVNGAKQGLVSAVDLTGTGVSTSTVNGLRTVTFVGGSGSGITRTIVTTSGSATMGNTASTDYVYIVAGAHTMSLPAAAANTNRYTVKNIHTAAVTVDTEGVELVEGGASVTLYPYDTLEFISDGTNWHIL